MASRRTFVLDKDVTDRSEAEAACAAVFEVLGPVLRAVSIDLISDHTARMPPAIREAEAVLRDLANGRTGTSRDPRMGVEVSAEQQEWSAAQAYAPWSINVDLLGEDQTDLGTLHDCGYSIAVELLDAEAEHLRERLREVAPVRLLSDIEQERKAERRQRRRQALKIFGRR